MPAVVTLIYPATPDHTFNLEYYLQTHMPLVTKLWSSRGLKGYQVIKLDQDGGYCTQCLLHWESVDAFTQAKAVAAESEAIFGDIPNFTNVKPTVLISGDIVASTV